MTFTKGLKIFFVLSLCLALNSANVGHAAEVGSTTNTIYFPEDIGIGGTGDPDPTPAPFPGTNTDHLSQTKPVAPSDSPSYTGFLPQTGEVKSKVLTIIGFIALLLVGLTIFLKSKKYKKRNRGE